MMSRRRLFSGFKTRLRERRSEATTTKQLMEKSVTDFLKKRVQINHRLIRKKLEDVAA